MSSFHDSRGTPRIGSAVEIETAYTRFRIERELIGSIDRRLESLRLRPGKRAGKDSLKFFLEFWFVRRAEGTGCLLFSRTSPIRARVPRKGHGGHVKACNASCRLIVGVGTEDQALRDDGLK